MSRLSMPPDPFGRDPFAEAIRLFTAPRPAPPPPQLTPQQQDDILGGALETGIAGLGYVGKVLDKTFGARAVRGGLLGGKPRELLSVLPFSDALGVTDERDVVHGTDLLADAGLITRGDDSFGNLAAGVGAEILLDPATYLTFGAGALTKAGKLASKVGGLPRGVSAKVRGYDVAESAIAPWLKPGQRVQDVARLPLPMPGLPFGHVTMRPSIMPEAVEQAAKAAGTPIRTGFQYDPLSGGLVKNMHDATPLSGVLGFGVPFGPTLGVLGTGAAGRKVAGILDKVGEGVLYSAPVRAVRAVLDPTTEGAISKRGQQLAPYFRDQQRTLRRETADEAVGLMQDAQDLLAGGDDRAAADALRMAAEFDPARGGAPLAGARNLLHDARQRLMSAVHPAGHPLAGQPVYTHMQADALLDIGQDLGARARAKLGRERAVGVDTAAWDSPHAGYFPRTLADLPWQKGESVIDYLRRTGRGFAGTHGSQIQREKLFDVPGGTVQLQDWVKDPALRGMTHATLTAHLAREIGGPAAVAGTDAWKQAEELATWLKGLPADHTAKGLDFFRADPFADLMLRGGRSDRAVAAAETAYEAVSRYAADITRGGHAPQPGDVPVTQLLKEIGLTAENPQGVYRSFEIAAQRLGLSNINDLSKFALPADVARDMVKFAKAWEAPAELSPVIAAWDWAGNLFKSWVTVPFPAFHARNLMSGLFNAWRDDALSPAAMAKAAKVIRGGTLDAPLPGMRATNPGDATKELIREMIVGRVAFTRGSGQAAVQGAAGPAPELIRRLPQVGTGKGVGEDLASFAGGLLPRKGHIWEDTSPFNIAGVNRELDTNVLIRQGRQVQGLVDDFVQASHYIALRQKGFTPDAAALKVKHYHNDYSELTPLERSLMKRVMPWYCVPTDHEILTRDGWKFHDQMTVGEDVLAYDHQAGTLHWTPLLEVNEFDFDGELMTLGCRGAKFLFTENHRWPVRMVESVVKGKKYGGQRLMMEGKDLHSMTVIPLTGDFGGEESILTPRQAAILGWVVTDGSCRWRGNHCEMVVYQSEKKYAAHLRQLLGVEPGKATDDRQAHKVYTFRVPLADAKAITAFYRSKEDLPAIAAKLSREAAEAMYDAMMMAEGSAATSTGQQHFAQSDRNRAVADAFQVLCVLTGRSAFRTAAGCYVRKTDVIWPKHWLRPNERYTGKVWCPTTAHGTWVMRHDGAVCITGNSFSRRNLPPLLEDVALRPGKVAAATRGITGTREPFEFVPPHVAEGASVRLPFGEPPGEMRFLSSFGLPIEDEAVRALGSFARGDVTRGLQGAIGQTYPLLKAPLEYAFDTQLYSGRKLQDLRPMGAFDQPGLFSEEDARKLSQVAANTPFSRFFTTIDKLSDPRKGTAETAVNLLTGGRITDVDAARERDVAARKLLEKRLRGRSGVRAAESVYVPRENLPLLSPQERQLYEVYQSAGKRLRERSKDRR